MDSILRTEIFQQPAILADLFSRERENVARMAAAFKRSDIDYLMIAARGSSDNAARYGQYLFGLLTGLPVALAAPSLFTLYQKPPQMRRSLVVAISQSGESTDILAVLEEGKRQGAPTLAITNEENSSLARTADCVIPLGAGKEKSIAATKTYTASLAALALLAVQWHGDAALEGELKKVPEKVAAVLDSEPGVEAVARTLTYLADCAVIGRGLNYATAFEVALKLKELAYVRAEPYSSADFLHGPVAIVEPNFCVLEIAPSGAVYASMLDFAARIKKAGGRLIAISDQQELLDLAAARLPLPAGVPEWLSPLVAVVPGQLLGLHTTLAKGYEADHPRGLAKVTLTL